MSTTIDIVRLSDRVTIDISVDGKRIKLALTHERAKRIAMELCGVKSDSALGALFGMGDSKANESPIDRLRDLFNKK